MLKVKVAPRWPSSSCWMHWGMDVHPASEADASSSILLDRLLRTSVDVESCEVAEHASEDSLMFTSARLSWHPETR